MSDAAIKNAVNDTGIFMQDMEERLRYINRQMAIMDYNTDMRVSREEGRAEGREEGREEGRAEGREEGARLADRRTVMRMLNKNKSIDEILEYVDLSREEILELAKKI